MDGRTYYMILGVPRTESPGGIRSAYRDLAKKVHPDVAGEQATHAFQEITEAYDVLSDPQRRRAYNEDLRRAEGGDVVPVRRTPPPRRARRPVSTFGAADAVRAANQLGGVNIEVVLAPDEWRRGCVLPIGVPVFRRCAECGGSGYDWLLPCLACGQLGTIEDEAIVHVRIPPMVRSGSIFEMPLRGVGINDFHLRLHVFVEPDVANQRR
jgi:DnaJ-class molecular chaperone